MYAVCQAERADAGAQLDRVRFAGAMHPAGNHTVHARMIRQATERFDDDVLTLPLLDVAGDADARRVAGDTEVVAYGRRRPSRAQPRFVDCVVDYPLVRRLHAVRMAMGQYRARHAHQRRRAPGAPTLARAVLLEALDVADDWPSREQAGEDAVEIGAQPVAEMNDVRALAANDACQPDRRRQLFGKEPCRLPSGAAHRARRSRPPVTVERVPLRQAPARNVVDAHVHPGPLLLDHLAFVQRQPDAEAIAVHTANQMIEAGQ